MATFTLAAAKAVTFRVAVPAVFPRDANYCWMMKDKVHNVLTMIDEAFLPSTLSVGNLEATVVLPASGATYSTWDEANTTTFYLADATGAPVLWPAPQMGGDYLISA